MKENFFVKYFLFSLFLFLQKKGGRGGAKVNSKSVVHIH